MRLLLLPLALALSACSLTPALLKPELPVPARYAPAATADSNANAADLGWRTMFGDRRLQSLIDLALRNNRDLRLAALNVEAAEAQYGIQRAARPPSVDAGVGLNRQRTPANRETDPATPAAVQNQYGVNLGVSAFEIDLFGRVRALSDAAFARYLATDHGRRAAQIALVGAVADAYFAERLAREQLALAEHTQADWRQSLALARRLRTRNKPAAWTWPRPKAKWPTPTPTWKPAPAPRSKRATRCACCWARNRRKTCPSRCRWTASR